MEKYVELRPLDSDNDDAAKQAAQSVLAAYLAEPNTVLCLVVAAQASDNAAAATLVKTVSAADDFAPVRVIRVPDLRALEDSQKIAWGIAPSVGEVFLSMSRGVVTKLDILGAKQGGQVVDALLKTLEAP